MALNCQNTSQNACYGCEKLKKSKPINFFYDGLKISEAVCKRDWHNVRSYYFPTCEKFRTRCAMTFTSATKWAERLKNRPVGVALLTQVADGAVNGDQWLQGSLKYFPRKQWPFYRPILTLPLGKNLQENKPNAATGTAAFVWRSISFCQGEWMTTVPHVLHDFQPSLFFCFDVRLITQKGPLCGQVFWNENKSCRSTVLNQAKSQTHISSDVH